MAADLQHGDMCIRGHIETRDYGALDARESRQPGIAQPKFKAPMIFRYAATSGDGDERADVNRSSHSHIIGPLLWYRLINRLLRN